MGNINLKAALGGQIAVAPTNTASNYTLTLPAATGNIITSADSGTVTQGMLASNVAGNGPAFRAYQSSQQTGISPTTNTKIILDVEFFDTNSNFSSSRFTPTVAGYYQFNAAIGIPDTTSNLGLVAMLFKNGAVYSVGASGMGSTGRVYQSSIVSDVIYLNGSSDYIELYVYGAQSSSFSIVNSNTQTYLSGFLARSA